ncbi:MAG TPA: hypothetical protein VFU32_06410 [Ktedonobacterales bacterium]|nr:hypothetical protein [Ktedonobacterales bacterium]
MVDTSALARPPASPADAGTSFDSCAYVATTLLHIRPFDPLQIELLRCCQAPIGLQALSAQMRFSPATIAWLLFPLLQHGMVRRVSLPPWSAEEKGAAR